MTATPLPPALLLLRALLCPYSYDDSPACAPERARCSRAVPGPAVPGPAVDVFFVRAPLPERSARPHPQLRADTENVTAKADFSELKLCFKMRGRASGRGSAAVGAHTHTPTRSHMRCFCCATRARSRFNVKTQSYFNLLFVLHASRFGVLCRGPRRGALGLLGVGARRAVVGGHLALAGRGTWRAARVGSMGCPARLC